LTALTSYLAQTLKRQLAGRLSLDSQPDWAAEPQTPVLQLALHQATLQDLPLRDRAGPRASYLASWRQLKIAQTGLNLRARQLRSGSLTLLQPRLAARHDAKGSLNLWQWVAAAPAGSGCGAAAPAATPPHRHCHPCRH
jgi:hypothetical protein